MIQGRGNRFGVVTESSDSWFNLIGRQLLGPLFFLPFIDPVFRFVKNGSEVGGLTKRWKGLLRESFSDGDGFDTDIDPSLSVTERVLLFGAVFLIDFGSVEDNQGQ